MYRNSNIEFLESPPQGQSFFDFFTNGGSESDNGQEEFAPLQLRNPDHAFPSLSNGQDSLPLFHDKIGSIESDSISLIGLEPREGESLERNGDWYPGNQLNGSQLPVELKREFKKNRSEKKTQDREDILDEDGEVEHHKNEARDPSDQVFQSEQKKQSRRKKKLIKKIDRFMLKEKNFKGADKISLPKKLGKLFINYIESYPLGEQPIDTYHRDILAKLKKTVKNDYTFEKTITQFLGITEIEGEIHRHPLWEKISRHYRDLMPEIIKKTMKQEVIMRQKIERNREIYMLQMKVYCLRCRSHALAQKGCFK